MWDILWKYKHIYTEEKKNQTHVVNVLWRKWSHIMNDIEYNIAQSVSISQKTSKELNKKSDVLTGKIH